MGIRYLRNTTGVVAATQLTAANLSFISNTVTISNSTPSISPTTGALVVLGGIGTGGNINAAGNLTVGNIRAFSANFTTNVRLGDTLSSQTIRNLGTVYTAGVEATNITTTNFTTSEIVTANIRSTYQGVFANLYANIGYIDDVEATIVNSTNFNATYGNLNELTVDTVSPRNYSQINFGDISKVRIAGGSSGQVLKTDGNGNLIWADGTDALVFQTGLQRIGNAVSLAGTGGTPGVYDRVTVDQYGRVVSGETVTDTLEVVTQRGNSTTQQLLITNGNESYDVDQGALIVTGGVGVGGTVTAGALDVKGTALFESDITADQNITVNRRLILDGANHGQTPVTINVGTLSNSPELGSIEFDGDFAYITTNIGRQIIQTRQLGSTSVMVFSVRAVATVNIDINNPSQSTGGVDNWDNVILNAFDRVLLTNQSSASQNGIYIWKGAGVALTRSTDFNSLSGIYSGSLIIVTEGTTQYSTMWEVETANPITVGSTSIVITQNINRDTLALSKLVKDSSAGLLTRTQYGTIAMRSLVSNTSWLTIANGTGKLGNITISTSIIPVTSGGTGRSAWFGYLKGAGATINSSNTIPRSEITGLSTMADQNANNVNIIGGNITNIGNISTANLTVTTTANIANLQVTTVTANTISTTNLTVANFQVSGAVNIPNLYGNVVQLGANATGSLSTNALSVSTTQTVTDTIALMNVVLGKLVPPPPPNFPASQNISVASLSTYRMTNFTQTDNSATGGLSVAGGTTVNKIRRASTYSTNVITSSGPGDTGRVTVYKNGSDAGHKDMVGGVNGTFTDLIITNNQDYHNVVSSVNPNFWYSFNAQASGTVSAGWNEVYIEHTAGSSTNTVNWYYDSSNPGAPTFANPQLTVDVDNQTYSSTVPHYNSNTRFNVTFDIFKLSGDTYPVSDTFAVGIAGGAFAAPESRTYSQVGIPTPLARNAYANPTPASFSPTHFMALDGNGDYLSSTNQLSLGTGDFTIEFWWYPVVTIFQQIGFITIGDISTNRGMTIATDNVRGVFVYSNTTYITSGAGYGHAPTLNVWNHIAVTRSSGTLRTFVNGVLAESQAFSANIDSLSSGVYIGALGPGVYVDGNGRLSNMRVLAGTCLYTSSFTPPTAELTKISNTILLIAKGSNFTDYSDDNRTFTANGNAAMVVNPDYSPVTPGITTKSNIISGFGSSSTGPSITVDNSYSTTTQIFSPGYTVLYKTGTGTQVEETAIPVNSVGVGSGSAYRIVKPGSGDTPTFTGSEAAFNSQTGTINTDDATVVAAVLKHDQTNYSSNYLPVGPNLSVGRAGAQYFTFKFVRTVVSKFDIKYTGTLAGLWVALPGSSIDTSSSINGWLDMSVAYNGAGVPGFNTNGSNGCAVGGTATLNSAVVNKSVTATFGTVSSSSTASNAIYVRVKLTAGQSLTALSIEAATH